MALAAQQAVDVLRAAGEPSRLRILALLAHEELAVMELSQILDQSQPRVSRHLKLLTEAGLVERFPDGAWMFYRMAAPGPRRQISDGVLALVSKDDLVLARDAERLQTVRSERLETAAAYFAQNAARWDELRSLYIAEADVEAAILQAAGPGPFTRLVDLGSGTGRMLQLLGPRARATVGLDLSQQMLNIARGNAARLGLDDCELRHGDIFATGLADGCADLVVIHQVLHYLSDPAAALAEAGRLVAPQGRLLIIDFAPHGLEFLRQAHQHRRLGFSDGEISRWCEAAGLDPAPPVALPPTDKAGLTVKIWSAARVSAANRSAA
jgi:ArsR family transcriptional regulator